MDNRDKEEEGRRLARHREDIGTQLYAYQQQLGSLQNNIELANEDRQWIDDKGNNNNSLTFPLVLVIVVDGDNGGI